MTGTDVLVGVVRALVESSALIAVALLLERFVFVRRRAVLRHVLWLAVAARLLVPPGLALDAPDGLRSVAAWSAGSAALARDAVSPMLSSPDWGAGLLVVWAGVALLLLARLLVRARADRGACLATTRAAPAAWRVEARAIARRLGLRRLPPLRVADDIPCAFVLGARRSLVVLPAGDDAGLREAALWHELAHVRRRDLWMQTAFAILRALWWPHPLAGVLQRRTAAAREVACDATVARVLGGAAPQYRHALLRGAAARWGIARPAPGSAAPWWRERGGVLVRLEALASPPGRAVRALRPVLGLGLVTLVLALGLVVLPAAAAGWWDDPDAAAAEAATWCERRPGAGCAPGRHIFLRALALSRARTSVAQDR